MIALFYFKGSKKHEKLCRHTICTDTADENTNE